MVLVLNQILLGVIFLALSLVVLTLPGFIIIKKIVINLDGIEKYTLSTVIGIVFFTLCAYIGAIIHLRFLMWTFPIVGVLSIVLLKKEILNTRIKIHSKIFFISVLIIGIIGQVAVNAPSGLMYKNGIYFWSSHGHDGVWHIALMEQMHKNIFPFQNPELTNYRLQNYHFFVDLLMSEFSRLFYFSNLDVYFRFIPILFSLLLGLSAFIFVRAWKKSELAGIWSMIFIYFAGSFGYLLYIPTHKSLGGEAIFWLSQTQSVLGNPPHASAFIITTVFLYCLLKYLDNRKLSYMFLCAILGGSVIEFKVYAGILILVGLLTIGLFELFIKRAYKILVLFIETLFISAIIYLPNSVNSQDFLIWQPWWFIRTMVVASDRLNWLDLELRRQTYVAEHNFKRVIELEAIAFLIFLFGNLGMRFLGFLAIFRQIKANIFRNSFNLFFLTTTLISFFIPVLFLQKGVAWNAIQFNQYFLLFFGYLAATSMVDILFFIKNYYFKIIFSILIILLAVPTQLGLIWQFYSNPPLSKVSYNELSALNFLKQQPAGIVLTTPFNRYQREKYIYPPVPIYSWYDTGYIPAFSGKETLISDEEQVNIMGYKVDKLIRDRQKAFESKDYNVMNNFLQSYKIDYIYLAWDQKIATDSSFLNADIVFKNNDATVFKVKK